MVDSLCVVVEDNLLEIRLALRDIMQINSADCGAAEPVAPEDIVLEEICGGSNVSAMESSGGEEFSTTEDIEELLRVYSTKDSESYLTAVYAVGESQSTEYLPYLSEEVTNTPQIMEEMEARVEEGVRKEIYTKKMNSSVGQTHDRRFESFHEQKANEWYCFINRFWVMLLYDITG